MGYYHQKENISAFICKNKYTYITLIFDFKNSYFDVIFDENVASDQCFATIIVSLKTGSYAIKSLYNESHWNTD